MQMYGHQVKVSRFIKAIDRAVRENKVSVGGDCPAPPGPEAANPYTGGQWVRRPLGSTRATVTAGSTGTFNFTSVVPYRPDTLLIDEQIASNFTITSLQIGLNQLIIAGEVPAANMASDVDACRAMLGAYAIFPSVPLVMIVRNDSASDLPFNASLNGWAQISC